MINIKRFLFLGLALMLTGQGCLGLGGGSPEEAPGREGGGLFGGGDSGCSHPYMPLRAGSSITYSSSGAEGTTWTQTIVENTGESATMRVHFPEENIELQHTINCESDGVYGEGYLDLNSAMTGQRLESRTVSASGPMLPADLDVGSEWSNHFVLEVSGPSFAAMGGVGTNTLDISRRAVRRERVSVTAGTFDALVVEASFNMLTEVGALSLPIAFTQTEYWVEGVGMVKSEGGGAGGEASVVQATRITR
jgi:hypothetical protein